MSNLRVGIIEDEVPAARLLERMVKQVRPNWDIVKIGGSVEAATKWFAENEHPDLLFLDIHLSDGNSFLFIKEALPQSLIIFTTAYDEYAIRAFKVNSIDYLLKPIREDRLLEAIEKYERITNKQQATVDEHNLLQEVLHSLNPEKKYRTRFLVSSGTDRLFALQASDIAYFYSINKITFAVTFSQVEYIVDLTLEKLGEQLDPDNYFRVNRQIIVNIEAIVKIEPYFLGKIIVQTNPPTKDKIIVSKGKASNFKMWLNY